MPRCFLAKQSVNSHHHQTSWSGHDLTPPENLTSYSTWGSIRAAQAVQSIQEPLKLVGHPETLASQKSHTSVANRTSQKAISGIASGTLVQQKREAAIIIPANNGVLVKQEEEEAIEDEQGKQIESSAGENLGEGE